LVSALVAALLLAAAPATAQRSAAELYAEGCAACHGADRLGGAGPALVPENLARLRRGEAVRVIAEGRAATQMPGFAASLAPDEIERLAAFVLTPPSS
jgi:mono/diheme cytochrome c family protein